MKKIVIFFMMFLLGNVYIGVENGLAANLNKEVTVKAKSEINIEGAVEGIRVEEDEIIAIVDEDMVFRVTGDIADNIRLMVMPIKQDMTKEWNWLQSITKKIGVNKSAYDIFFINSSGVRVDAGKGSQISVMSRDRLKDIHVYFIENDGKQQKLKSIIEEYVVKFNMVKNGYYTLVIANEETEFSKDKTGIDRVDDGLNVGGYGVKDKESSKNNSSTNKNTNTSNKDTSNKDNTGKNDDKNTDNDSISNEEDGIGTDGSSSDTDGADADNSKDELKTDGSSEDDSDKGKENDINIIWILCIVGVFIVTVFIFIIILKRNKKKEEEES